MRINKKGFTLIELLAVIIVLAVVTLLAVQAILPQVDKARKNAFVVEANNAIEAAKQYYGTQELENPEAVSGECVCIPIATLKNSGYYETSGTYSGCVKIKKENGIVKDYYIELDNRSYKTSSIHKGKITTADANKSSDAAVVAATSTAIADCSTSSCTCPTS